jgi:hypothetical protein
MFEVIRVVGGTQRAPRVRHVDLRVDGRSLRVPVEWTDLANPATAALSSRLSVPVLLALAELVDGKELGQSAERCMSSGSERTVSSHGPTGQHLVGGVGARRAASCAGGTGRRRASVAVASRGERRGTRSRQ